MYIIELYGCDYKEFVWIIRIYIGLPKFAYLFHSGRLVCYQRLTCGLRNIKHNLKWSYIYSAKIKSEFVS